MDLLLCCVKSMLMEERNICTHWGEFNIKIHEHVSTQLQGRLYQERCSKKSFIGNAQCSFQFIKGH